MILRDNWDAGASQIPNLHLPNPTGAVCCLQQLIPVLEASTQKPNPFPYGALLLPEDFCPVEEKSAMK